MCGRQLGTGGAADGRSTLAVRRVIRAPLAGNMRHTEISERQEDSPSQILTHRERVGGALRARARARARRRPQGGRRELVRGRTRTFHQTMTRCGRNGAHYARRGLRRHCYWPTDATAVPSDNCHPFATPSVRGCPLSRDEIMVSPSAPFGLSQADFVARPGRSELYARAQTRATTPARADPLIRLVPRAQPKASRRSSRQRRRPPRLSPRLASVRPQKVEFAPANR